MNIQRIAPTMALVLAAGSLVACGGGGGNEATDSSEITTVGTISGFGSIYVNGIKFDTSDTTYDVDGVEAFDDSALAVGMKVKVEGTVNAGSATGTASHVLYQDDVEGPIENLTVIDASRKSFEVLGLVTTVDINRTVFDGSVGFGFDNLANGQVVEVSGYFDGNAFVAARIEKQDALDNEFELRGTVANYTPGINIGLTLQNGASASFPISPLVALEIPADPLGLFVEVKLIDQGGTLVATRIELDDEDQLDGEDGDVSIRGMVTRVGSNLLVNGIVFAVSDLTEYRPSRLVGMLKEGMEVEVEGSMQDGILFADEVEAEEGEIEIEARVTEVTFTDAKNGTVIMDLGNSQTLIIHSDNGSLFKDDSNFDLDDDDSFNLNELTSTDFVDIEALRDDLGRLIATSIKREDAAQATTVEAPIDAFESLVSVTTLGITYTVNGSTEYESTNDMAIDATSFFAALDTGTVIKIKDDDADGTADEIELED